MASGWLVSTSHSVCRGPERRQVLALSLNLTSSWEEWDALESAGNQTAMLAYHRKHLQEQLDQVCGL